MIGLFKKHVVGIVLFGIVLLLFIFQWTSLSNPYFWDEMGVYGYGVQYMFEHGISLLPKGLPPDISRGHPLLLYSVHALALKIFGNSFFVSHSFALFFSALTLMASYRLARNFTAPIIALLVPILLVVQNIFLAQSTLILPEMLVALLTVLAFNSYFRKRYLWSITFLCLGVLIKESVIVTAGFIGVVHFVQLIQSRKFKHSIFVLFGFTAPLFVLALFLLVQKAQNGWYLFPYHTDLVSEGVFDGFIVKFAKHLLFLFFEQGRFLWFPFLFIAGLAAAIFSKSRKEIIILLAFLIYSLSLFSLAFYMDRYLLYLYPIIAVVIVAGVSFLFKRNSLIWIIGGTLCFFPLLDTLIAEPKFHYDVDVSYCNIIDIHKQAVSDLCILTELLPDNKQIQVFANFPINMSLWESSFGYARPECLSKISLTGSAQEAEYIIILNETGEGFDDINLGDYNSKEIYQNNTGSILVYHNFNPLKE